MLHLEQTLSKLELKYRKCEVKWHNFVVSGFMQHVFS